MENTILNNTFNKNVLVSEELCTFWILVLTIWIENWLNQKK